MVSTYQLIQFIRARLDEDSAMIPLNFSPARARAQVEATRTVLAAWEDIDYSVPDYVIEALVRVYQDHRDYPG